MASDTIIILIISMTFATIVTRVLPFLLPSRWAEHKWVKRANHFLPGSILTLLVFYAVKDTAILDYPFGLPEIASASVVVILHLWKKNTLLSIAGGTAVYMILIRIL